ncbi:MAG: alcohol dehydrogenase catalytic domain-containing protein [Lachnospiraceae bacterium]
MKAAVYRGNGELSVEDWNGRMPEEKEVQIRVSYCGICGSDIHILQGTEDSRMNLPSVIGHECSGTVWHVGNKVKNVKPGDRVVVWPVKSCKECYACKEGYGHVCQNLKVRGIETDGAFQYAWTLDEEALVRLPDTVSMLHGALAEPLAICCHVVKRGNLKRGDFTVIIGGGPIGIMTALVAKAAGAEVLLSEVNEKRLEKANEMGICTINPIKENLLETVKNHTAGRGADIVFETSGSQPGVDSMVYLPKVHGTVVLVAIYGKPMTVDLKQLYYHEKNIVTARMQEREDMEKAISLLEKRKVNADKIITSVLPLEDIKEGFSKCMDRNGSEVKVMIQCSID